MYYIYRLNSSSTMILPLLGIPLGRCVKGKHECKISLYYLIFDQNVTQINQHVYCSNIDPISRNRWKQYLQFGRFGLEIISTRRSDNPRHNSSFDDQNLLMNFSSQEAVIVESQSRGSPFIFNPTKITFSKNLHSLVFLFHFAINYFDFDNLLFPKKKNSYYKSSHFY